MIGRGELRFDGRAEIFVSRKAVHQETSPAKFGNRDKPHLLKRGQVMCDHPSIMDAVRRATPARVAGAPTALSFFFMNAAILAIMTSASALVSTDCSVRLFDTGGKGTPTDHPL